MDRKRSRVAEAGFSLVELMVVIAIMAVLAGGVAVFLFGALEDAEKTRVKSDFAQLRDAIEMFKLKTRRYPETLEDLTKPISGQSKAYLDRIPKDPWGEPYIYRKIEGGFELITLGADKAEGGDAADADISSLDQDEEEFE